MATIFELVIRHHVVSIWREDALLHSKQTYRRIFLFTHPHINHYFTLAALGPNRVIIKPIRTPHGGPPMMSDTILMKRRHSCLGSPHINTIKINWLWWLAMCRCTSTTPNTCECVVFESMPFVVFRNRVFCIYKHKQCINKDLTHFALFAAWILFSQDKHRLYGWIQFT